MDDLISRKKVLDTIYDWVITDENIEEDAIQLLGDRIRAIPSEELQS